MSNKKILIVTYYWPPSGGVGVQRWMNYAIQLKKRGWEPIIFTPENPQFEIKDSTQLELVKEIRVVKTNIWEPFDVFHQLTANKNRKNIQQGLVLEKANGSWKDKLFVWIRGNLFVPDPRKFWVRPSTRFLKDFIVSEEIQTVITTGPPHSMHLIGLGLNEQIEFKWIADFRDPWSDWDVLDKLRTGSLARRRHKRLERRVLQSADKVLTVSSQLQKSLSALGGEGKVSVQFNGVSIPLSETKPLSDTLVLGYYGMLNELRNPSELWKVLDDLASRRKLELRLGGVVSESIKSEIDALPHLSKSTHFLGYLNHLEVQVEYSRCTILVLLLNRSDNAKWILPVKFFEYLSANRRILALGPKDSDLEEIAREVPTFGMMTYDDLDGIRLFIEASDDGFDFSASKKLLERFSHANLASHLEAVINELHE